MAAPSLLPPTRLPSFQQVDLAPASQTVAAKNITSNSTNSLLSVWQATMDVPSFSPTSAVPAHPATAAAAKNATANAKLPLQTVSPTAIPQIREPTGKPSLSPTAIFRDQQSFRQGFVVPSQTSFFFDYQAEIQDLFQAYTEQFAPGANESVTSSCKIKSQQIQKKWDENTANGLYTLELDYSVSYFSTETNVNEYSRFFLKFMNSNLASVSEDTSKLVNFTVVALEASMTVLMTGRPTEPTSSLVPSTLPTPSPMRNYQPSEILMATELLSPSTSPISSETLMTKEPLPPSPPPISSEVLMTKKPLPPSPSISLITTTPTTAPTSTPTVPKVQSLTVIFSGLLALVVLLAIFCFCRRQKRRMMAQYDSATNEREINKNDRANAQPTSRQDPSWMTSDIENGKVRAISPIQTVPSNDSKSLLSIGDLGTSDSDFEADGVDNLKSEFDEYKSQNLEAIRWNLLGNLNKLFIRDGQAHKNSTDFWGCQANPSGAEVEASALYEVTNWLQRHQNANTERRRVFMQEILDKMVASVCCGVIEAEDASRTIHESAALLSFALANKLPNTTVIISGMRKKTTSQHMLEALSEFGKIDAAAVASGLRGFGIVRFRHPKSVYRAMLQYRNSEIVVQDVAIQMRAPSTSRDCAHDQPLSQ